MKYVKIVQQGGSYNGKPTGNPTYVLIDIETSNQSNMFFDSYVEAKKYCVKKGFEVVNQKYNLDWNFDLKKVQQFLENYKKVKTKKLSENRETIRKLIEPIIKNILNERVKPCNATKNLPK
jgi:hypothetical protein